MRAPRMPSVAWVPEPPSEPLPPHPGRGPLESYRHALTCLDAGDEVGARRAVEEGLARSWRPQCAQVRECLDDLGAQLDGEAALRRFAARTPGPRGWLAHPADLAHDVIALRRAHLVEAVIEEVAVVLPGRVLQRLLVAMRDARTRDADDLLLACAAVLAGRAAREARRLARGARATSPVARALAHPRLAAAWVAGGHSADGQQQMVLAVARDGGRVGPLVALVDHAGAGPMLRDAFFLPDMVPGRLEREVLRPMAAAGMRAAPVAPDRALGSVSAALGSALAAGRPIPSEAHQSVITRMRRLHAACGGSCADPSAGTGPLVG